MPRPLLWAVAALAATVTAALVVVLWRRRKHEAGRWTTQDLLTALGIVLALFVGVVSLLAAQGEEDDEPAEVTTYRQEVRAVCSALAANNQSVDLALLADSTGNVRRDELMSTFNAQLDTALEILNGLWATAPPDQLSAAVAEARSAADVLLFTERGAVAAMAGELPETISLASAVSYLQQSSIELLPLATDFQGAMSTLAGEECRPDSE